MPTMAAVSFERLLLEERTGSSHSSKPYYNSNISPALYATPPDPITTTTSQVGVQEDQRQQQEEDLGLSPTYSPYVFNRKGLLKHSATSTNSLAAPAAAPAEQEKEQSEELEGFDKEEEELEDKVEEEEDKGQEEEDGDGDEDDEFFDPRDTRSVASGCSGSSSIEYQTPLLMKQQLLTNGFEFFDAADDFFSDSSASQASLVSKTGQIGLGSLRLSLFEEKVRRGLSEESLLVMQNQLQTVLKSLAQLHVPAPVNQNAEDVQYEADPAELCQEIVVLSFVSEGIERTLTRIEAEAVAEETVESKNNEIFRLRDKLKYYETVNHEIYLKNQEAKGEARKRRLRRQKWIWSGVGLAVSIGASCLAYSYLSTPTEKASGEWSSSRSVESGK